MTRQEEIRTMKQVTEPDHGMCCNHVGFLDRYDWGLTCGNCGAAWVPINPVKQGEDKPNAPSA